MLLIIIDASDPEFRTKLDVTEALLEELGAGGKPTVYVFNKCDLGVAEYAGIGRHADRSNTVYISAATGQGIELLVSKIEDFVLSNKRRISYTIPNSEAGALNLLYKHATVEEVEYGAENIKVTALADARARGLMKKYADIPERETKEEDFD